MVPTDEMVLCINCDHKPTEIEAPMCECQNPEYIKVHPVTGGKLFAKCFAKNYYGNCKGYSHATAS